MSLRTEKLATLVESEGYDSDIECAENCMMSGTCPGICMNDGCEATYDYEPDCSHGWCAECETNSVKSLFILMGII